MSEILTRDEIGQIMELGTTGEVDFPATQEAFNSHEALRELVKRALPYVRRDMLLPQGRGALAAALEETMRKAVE